MSVNAFPEQPQAESPPGVLTWCSVAERSKLLIRWRLAVSITFAEQPRCLRVAWMLDHLFNAKTGFCIAGNTYLGKLTGLPVGKVQETLLKLEEDGAIKRSIIPPAPGMQRWRATYPATAILSVLGGGSPLPVGVTGNPRQPGVQILRRIHRPKNQFENARRAAELRGRESARGGTARGSAEEDLSREQTTSNSQPGSASDSHAQGQVTEASTTSRAEHERLAQAKEEAERMRQTFGQASTGPHDIDAAITKPPERSNR